MQSPTSLLKTGTASINEYSARYSILDREFYFPKFEDMAAQSTQNHQGRGETLSMAEAEEVFNILKTDALKCYDDYEYMLNENPDGTRRDESRKGLARELARMNLPVNVYTQWYWKTDLHNLFHSGFLPNYQSPKTQNLLNTHAHRIITQNILKCKILYISIMKHDCQRNYKYFHAFMELLG